VESRGTSKIVFASNSPLSRRTGQALTCIIADIDHFAAINESFAAHSATM